jgi:hypothetical protein
MSFKIYNQYHYPNTPYPSSSHPSATVKSGGCGVTSAAMIVSAMTDTVIDPAAMAKFAIAKGARAAEGTDMNVLAKAVCSAYGLTYTTTNDETKLMAHLKAGGLAIANVSGNRYGWTGVFSSGGHYIVVAGTVDNKVLIADPAYYNGKFNSSGRAGKVAVDSNAYCYCDISVLGSDTLGSMTAYWLFSKKSVIVDPAPAVVVEPPALTSIHIVVAGKNLQGYLRDNHSFCPTRDTMDALGVSFTWDAETESAVVGDSEIPVIIKDGKGYSLASEIAKVTSHKISWDGPTMTATIA